MLRNWILVVPLLLCALEGQAGPVAAQDALAALERQVPRTTTACDDHRAQAVARCGDDLETWAAELVTRLADQSAPQVIADLRVFIRIDRRVDQLLDDLVQLRTRFVELPAGPLRRAKLRGYLATTSTMIDLSGRLQYLLHDAVNTASYILEKSPQHFEQMLDTLTTAKLSMGAVVISYVLFDPLEEGDGVAFSRETKMKTLRLIREARAPQLLGDLADFLQQPDLDADLIITAAEAIHHIGLPQTPRPGEPTDALIPPIIAQPLRQQLLQLSLPDGNVALARRRDDLLSWLERRAVQGVTGDSYRMGNLELRRGDWLLMRNPSPYNRFTDLSPGLFTHVGVVTTEVGSDGIRRFVIVDLPERGDRIPAHNVETYLSRSLHYVFLRHADRAVADRLGEVAHTLIGNETQFDLTFRTDRLEALRGQPLQGKLINTYCAGFLLLCAQRTDRPRQEFFPIPEFPAGGHCLDNLGVLGLSIGDNFVSPTGAFFSASAGGGTVPTAVRSDTGSKGSGLRPLCQQPCVSATGPVARYDTTAGAEAGGGLHIESMAGPCVGACQQRQRTSGS